MNFNLEGIVGKTARNIALAGALILPFGAGEAQSYNTPILAQQKAPQKDQQPAEKMPIPSITPDKEVELRKTYSKELSSKEKDAVDKLLKDALDTKDEPATQFALFNYAFQKASDIFDFPDAFKVVDELDKRYIDINPTGMKLRALDDARKKKPKGDQLEALVGGDMEFAAYEMGLGQKNTSHYDMAATAAKNAADGAKISKNKPTEDKAAAIQKYASDLSKNKDDAFTLAKFKYFIQNDSGEEVLKTISNNTTDAKLKKLAGLQTIGGTAAENYYEYGDAAYDAANDSGRLPHEKFTLQSVALDLYNKVTSTATGASKTKFERDEKLKKRKSELEGKIAQYGALAGDIDIINMIDIKKDVASGDWKKTGQSLISSDKRMTGIIKMPYTPPAEYDLTINGQSKDGIDCLIIGLTKDNTQFAVQIDGYPNNGTYTGVELIDGKNVTTNETGFKGKLLKANKPSTIVCAVRNSGITITVDGKKVSEYKGAYTRLTQRADYSPQGYKGLYLSAWDSAFELNKIAITPVSGGAGKKNH